MISDIEIHAKVELILDKFPMGGGVSYLTGVSHGFANFDKTGKKLFLDTLDNIMSDKEMMKCPRCSGQGALVESYNPKPLLNKTTYELCSMCKGVRYVFRERKE